VAMRPPLPSLTLSRRVKISLAVAATIIVLLIVAASLVGVYINWLWFGEVGYRGVYRGIISTKLVLFVIFGVLMALILGGQHPCRVPDAAPPFRRSFAEQPEPRALPGDSRAAQSDSSWRASWCWPDSRPACRRWTTGGLMLWR